jgi:uncharacterized protein YbaA (DUF1428 family)
VSVHRDGNTESAHGHLFDWHWNVYKSRASERAASAYIMSDGVLAHT